MFSFHTKYAWASASAVGMWQLVRVSNRHPQQRKEEIHLMSTYFVLMLKLPQFYRVDQIIQFIHIMWMRLVIDSSCSLSFTTQIARFMGPTWGPPGSCRPQMGPCWPHEPCYQGTHMHELGHLGTWICSPSVRCEAITGNNGVLFVIRYLGHQKH